MIELIGHPFSSYTWKALIAFYENAVPFTFRALGPEAPHNLARLREISPLGKFPAIIDGDHSLFEASIIIEYLQQRYPGPAQLIPDDPARALEVRMLDRFFDNYVMTPMQRIVGDHIRASDKRDATTVTEAMEVLQQSYRWLDQRMADRVFACGDSFSLADCAAAPSLFYADWVCGITPDLNRLRAYRERLLARPSVKRCVDEARPYRSYFPPGAPDRD